MDHGRFGQIIALWLVNEYSCSYGKKKKLEGMFREIYSENSPLKAKSDEKKHILSQMLVYTLLQISAYFFSELLFKFDLGARKKARKKALRFRLGTL